jgi:hypothetical protein
MNKNKKVLLLILIATVFFVNIYTVSFGADAVATLSVKQIIENAKTSLTGIGISLATIAFIVSGIMFLSATGNPSRMTIAKGSLIAGITGIAIIALSAGAEAFVKAFFGIK